MSYRPILEVKDLKKHFGVGGGQTLKAVHGISFEVYKGETFGLVGESGCGKSTAGRTLLTLYPKTDGEVLYDGEDVHKSLEKNRLHYFRKMQMIFQDPYASLNPRHKVERIISEPLLIHGMKSSKERKERVKELLEIVGLEAYHASRYPHQFSGGQRQRIGIARALANNPKLIICDEPVSALDVSVQSQILNLMEELREKFKLTYVFIAHDLSVVKHISDRVGVMYLGRMVELTDKHTLFNDPKHPYTRALMSAVPIADPDIERERIILGRGCAKPFQSANRLCIPYALSLRDGHM